ncbi:acetyl-CoA carboxylase, biotin carboxyl carrier protein [Rhodoplanes sp. TEM]|uniref:Acetyl-CoA carboxylase, biotin carboxyl carrier protein n=1 Tax=Rhodoplanes tepidamans TaxID=200616 RepID=A0ABT5JHB4_RHOTP|nr:MULTISPECIES: biotin/lipoyl-containing protein [Rhodoplanes]MDC7788969.1 acetyl-CoA carboxylase, biotin carboxyl carrier protein [Rhodoplanes tepidamans]MDC7987220.1 acetyl-CoA carboxylase, biotin carboxyl carrier protein [Rhodoplanes sp. TEM]MDQ0358663.1 biotin carboxyl carrier protein [Rhodoplanes tepidamans]
MMRHLRITVDGRVFDVVVEDITEAGAYTPAPIPAPVAHAPVAAPRPAPAPAPAAPPPAAAPAPAAAAPASKGGAPSGGADDRLAPLAGVVLEVSVSVGDKVDVDDQVVVLEAMKMKTVIGAHKAGTVTGIHVKEGDAVDADQPLVTIS